MQCLYTANRDITLTNNLSLATQVYQEAIRKSYELYLFNVLQVREITKHNIFRTIILAFYTMILPRRQNIKRT